MKWFILTPPVAILAAVLLGLVLYIADSCSDEPAPPRFTAHGKPIPPSWEAFEFGDLSGAQPRAWIAELVSTAKLQGSLDEGLWRLQLTEEAGALMRDVDLTAYGDSLIFLAGPFRFPSVGIYPCVEGAEPFLPGSVVEALKAEPSAFEAHAVGEAEYEGATFAIASFKISDEFDSYMTLVGDAACTSIVYFYSEPGDKLALGDMRMIVSFLHVGPGEIGLPVK